MLGLWFHCNRAREERLGSETWDRRFVSLEEGRFVAVRHAGIGADKSPREDQCLQRGTLLYNSWALFLSGKAVYYRSRQWWCLVLSCLNFWKVLLEDFFSCNIKRWQLCQCCMLGKRKKQLVWPPVPWISGYGSVILPSKEVASESHLLNAVDRNMLLS